MKWITPNRSGANGACWDALNAGDRWFLRDTKDNEQGPVLEYTQGQWRELIAAVQAGTWPSWVTLAADGSAQVRMPGVDEPVLRFNPVEMDAFAGSVRDGQRELLPVGA